MVVNEFCGCVGLSFEVYCWLVLVWIVLRNVCKKENVVFSKELLSKICQNPCSCFSYRLSYNHPHEVSLMVKEP